MIYYSNKTQRRKAKKEAKYPKVKGEKEKSQPVELWESMKKESPAIALTPNTQTKLNKFMCVNGIKINLALIRTW